MSIPVETVRGAEYDAFKNTFRRNPQKYGLKQFRDVANLFFAARIATRFVEYDDTANTEGLTVWSVKKAKESFKGSKLNEEIGEIVVVNWKKKDEEADTANFSKNDMERMKAGVGDLVYLCDARKYFGGLKSVHTVYGEPHDEDGVVYIDNENLLNGQFVEGKPLTAEKEM